MGGLEALGQCAINMNNYGNSFFCGVCVVFTFVLPANDCSRLLFIVRHKFK